PVVWTLHDQWAFTGGCHYAAGCRKYRTDCMGCPQLDDDSFNLPAAILKDKQALFEEADITIVTPSRWMAECAKESHLFKDLRVEVIPNSLETDLYTPSPKAEAKRKLGLEGDTVTLLFGGEDGNERRKGFFELASAVKYLKEKSEFKALLETKKVCVLCFGRPSEELTSMRVPVVALGYLGSDLEIRDAYCAADVFILPSLEDNLPNTVLEAMSCGTPVVAFEIGGMPDMVDDGITGQLVPVGDTKQLGEAMLSLLLDSNRRKLMGEKCREKIEAEYPLSVQALRYSALYEELISENKPKTPAGFSGKDELWEGFSSENLLSSASFEAALGHHFERVYDKILFNALKETVFQIYQKWQDAESDRTARLQVINDQGERIVALDAEVDRWLNESRRLQDCVHDLASQGRDSKTKNFRAEIKLLENRIVDIEADRVARLQVINDQGGRIAELDAEVDRWLNESRRLQKAYSEIERERNELKLEVMKPGKSASLKILEKISLLPGRLRETPLILKDMKDKRLAYFMALKKILRGDAAKDYKPVMGNRQKITSRVTLASFKNRIDSFNASQSNRGLLDGIRLFNHSMLDQFNDMFPLKGCTLLDVGASPHGYALERALACGVTFYAGIGLDIGENEYVIGDGDNVGMLLNMDAAAVKFPDAMFDAVFSVSVFEHVSHVSRALAEIRRVLKIGGCALISFEPVWSCSYGHHLHHFAECADLIPPWGHLIWSPDQMRDYLSRKWPLKAPLSLDEAIDWIYYGNSINRLNIRQFKELFDNCGLTVSWAVDLKDEREKYDPVLVQKGCEATGLDPHELMTKGMCVLLTKEPPQK
ncbi:MAG: glycosyltransferase, partial [Deltaproteobacteria bacterium]|nr:glycosyltransferase [Deltaproteobacteria bacterium]